MKAKSYYKFPCGYEHYVTVQFGLFDFFSDGRIKTELKVCPIHHKDCKK